MNRDELKKLIRGIIVATPTPFNDNLEVDYGKMADMTKWWISEGLVKSKAVIKCVSLMGEGPQLTHDEWPLLLKSVINAAEEKVPVIGCIHSADTKKSITDALIAQDLGATGLQVSAPLFNDPNQDDILRYFEALSNSIEIGIMVYQTPWNKYGEIMPETFKKMADFEHVMAIKWCEANTFEYKEMKQLAPYFLEGLFSLKDIEVVENIRGYGMMGGIDIKMDQKPGKAGFTCFTHCYDAGVNFKATGDCLIIAPPFVSEKKHIDEIVDKLRIGITNYSKSKKN